MSLPELAHITVRESSTAIAAAVCEQIPELADAKQSLAQLRGKQPYTVAGYVNDRLAGCIVGHDDEQDGAMRLLLAGVVAEHAPHDVLGPMFDVFAAEATARRHDKIVVRGNQFSTMLGAMAGFGFGFTGFDDNELPQFVLRLTGNV